MLERLQKGDQCIDVARGDWLLAVHCSLHRFTHGGVQIGLPAVPGPGGRLFDSVEGQHGFKGEGGTIIKGIHAFRVNTTFIVT